MSSGLRWRMFTFTSIVLLAMCGELWAQDGTSAPHQRVDAEDPFSAYHDALDQRADRILVRPGDREGTKSSVPDQTARIEPPMLTDRLTGGGSVFRLRQLRPLVDPILQQEGVPTELAAVVQVESDGQPLALSPKGARGIWQFMPDTARRYGLVIDVNQDERLDVVKSTRAAARYLRDLYDQFGNWPLALAAYNTGERRIQQAVDSTGSSDFFAIRRRLPVETQNYVPAVLAATGAFPTPATPAKGPDHEGRHAQIMYASLGQGSDAYDVSQIQPPLHSMSAAKKSAVTRLERVFSDERHSGFFSQSAAR